MMSLYLSRPGLKDQTNFRSLPSMPRHVEVRTANQSDQWRRDVKIIGLSAHDVRFPTSRTLDGSDAMHRSPDYSAAYVVLHTDDPDLSGHGLTFTNGRGTEVCVAAICALEPLVVGRTLEGITGDFAGFWRSLVSEDQLRWLGPEKGVIHLSTAAIVNAVWDLWAKTRRVPRLAAPRRPVPRGDRLHRRLPLHLRRDHAG